MHQGLLVGVVLLLQFVYPSVVSAKHTDDSGTRCLGSAATTTYINELQPSVTSVGSAGFVIKNTGHYALSRDLRVPGTEIGILVLSGNATVDLAGRTISDPNNQAVLVRVVSGARLTIRSGSLIGGATGIVASGSQLVLENVHVIGDSNLATYSAVVSTNLGRIDILSSRLVAEDVALSISGTSEGSVTRGRILSNMIASRGRGLVGQSLQDAEISGNVIHAAHPVSVFAQNVLSNNRIVGGVSGYGAIEITSQSNRVLGNLISAWRGSYAVAVRGPYNELSGNLLSGGGEATILLSSTAVGTRVEENRIKAREIGLRVERQHNLIEGNVFLGKGLVCGIDFTGSQGNVYRDNVFDNAGEPTCGETNIDGGGNDVRDCSRRGESECGSDTLLRGVVHSNTPRLSPRRGSDCIPEDSVVISDWQPRTFGTLLAGVLIDVPGYYVLTDDLMTPNYVDHAVIIAAPDVTLDFDGHSIVANSTSRPSAELVRIIGSQGTRLRNGHLAGGRDGIFATGDGASDLSRVEIERLFVSIGDDSKYTGLTLRDIGHVEIKSSRFEGYDLAAWIQGESTGKIEDSEFIGIDVGLHAAGFEQGEFLWSRCHGDLALALGSGNVIEGNWLNAGISMGSENQLVNNVIGRNFFPSIELPVGADKNVIQRNLLSGVVDVLSSGNQLLDNFVKSDYVLMSVGGADNIISNNMLIAGENCGLAFENSDGHTYSNNVMFEVQEAVCGLPNANAGGNVLPASQCGNGLAGEAEMCDFPDLRGQTCESLGFAGGGLLCKTTCDAYDFSRCTSSP